MREDWSPILAPQSDLSLTCIPSRFMGGNSTKATSGINGAGTQAQQELGIPDNAKLFFEDTKNSVRTHLLMLTNVVFNHFCAVSGS